MPTPLLRLALATAVLSSAVASQATWRQLQPAAKPPARTNHVCTADFSSLLVFGGRSGSTYLSDTWRFAAGKWQKLAPKTSPGPISGACSTWSSARGVPVFFGGRKSSTTGKLTDETWEYMGGNWILVKPSTRPPARSEAAMAYESVRRRAILFGGIGTKLLGDTWTYRAGTWTRLNPQTSPSARRGHAMAQDKQRGRILLFGGRTTVALGDTWEWNGTTWRRIATSNSPPARWGHALTHDPGRERYVLFGGFDGSKTLDTTWEFDGADWIERKPVTRPSARTGLQLHYLIGLDHSAGFGGADNKGAALDDTWQYHNANPATFSNFGSGCTGSVGKPFIIGSRPWMGDLFTTSIVNTLPLTPAYLNIGLSKTTWGSTPLPFDLKGLGAPGCRMLVEPLLTVLVPNSLGRTHLTVRIPLDVRAIGVTIYEQAWSLDAKANKLGVVVTDAGAARIGAK